MAATLANIVREVGEFEFAVSLTSNVLAKLDTAPPQLQAEEHRLRYDLGCSLSVLGKTAEAFEQAMAINVDGGGEGVELRVELLDEIACSIKFQRERPTGPHPPARDMSSSTPENPRRSFTLELELQVRRERARLTHTPSPSVLLELAALLCRLGSPQQLQEGIDTYSRALQVNPSHHLQRIHVTHTPPRLASLKQTARCKPRSRAASSWRATHAPLTCPTDATGGCWVLTTIPLGSLTASSLRACIML